MADYYIEEWKRLPSVRQVQSEIEDEFLQKGLGAEKRFGFDPKRVVDRPVKKIAEWLLNIMDCHEYADSYVCTLVDSCIGDLCQDKKFKSFNMEDYEKLIDLLREHKELNVYYS